MSIDGNEFETRKKKVLREFTTRLQQLFQEGIAMIYVYGSLAKGTATPSSDIDVLIVYKDIEMSELLDAISEITFNLACEYGELIEVVLLNEKEFKDGVGSSPFLWEVLEHGKALVGASYTEWTLDFKGYLQLAEEYLRYARDAVNEGKVRLGIDAGYNAIELTIKALILSSGTSLASSHGGIIQQFGKLFVKTGKIGEEFGKEVSKALTLRAQARYVPPAKLKREDGELVLLVADKILEIARKEILERSSEEHRAEDDSASPALT